MQTTPLSPQLNIGAASAAQRSNAANAASDGSQFGAMLSNEMAQAQASAPAPTAPTPAPAAPKQAAPTPAQTDQPAQADDTPAAQTSATPDGTKPATKDADASARSGDDAGSKDKATDAAAQNVDPASAMLALMASLQHAAVKPGAAGAAPSSDALGGNAAKGKRTDSTQLAALQAAMKSVSKDGADAKAGAAASKTAAADGAAFGVEDKAGAAGAGANAATGLGAALAGAKSDLKPQLDAAELTLQKAREAAQLAAQQDPAALATAAVTQVQPAALEAAQAAASASEGLNAQVGSDAWENQLGQKVVYMVGSEEQTASLTLNPPDLGPMQVVLSVSNDQASVTFSSNQLEVRQALENALPRLREMMSDSGIALGNATVNAGMPDGRQAQQDQSSRGGNSGGSGRGRVDGLAASADAPARAVTRTIRGDNGMVDTFA